MYTVIILRNIDFKRIGERIKARRKAVGMSQEQLADLCFVSVSYIGHIERGNRNMSLAIAINISDALGVGLDYLFFGNAESDAQFLHSLDSVLKKADESQKNKLKNAIKILADNIDEL